MRKNDLYFYSLLYLVGRSKFCVTIGDVSTFFDISHRELLNMSRKIIRKHKNKFKVNVDQCLKRISTYCKDFDPNLVMNYIETNKFTGRIDVILTALTFQLFKCDVTELFGVSYVAIKYHIKKKNMNDPALEGR